MNKDLLMTKKEVQEYLKISHGTLYILMKRGAFPYIKLDRKVLFRKRDIDAFLESRLIK